MGKFMKNELSSQEENSCPNTYTGQTLDNASVIDIHDLEASLKTIEESGEIKMKFKKILIIRQVLQFFYSLVNSNQQM
jgi:hypothetical protein